MSKKIEIIGQALVITDTDTFEIIADLPKSEIYYKHKLLVERSIISLYNVDNNDNLVSRPELIALSDAVDSTDTPFTESSFIDFARTNLGFKTASGGSGAVDSVNSKTGIVVLNPDDLDDTSTTNKFTSTSEKNTWNSKQNAPSEGAFVDGDKTKLDSALQPSKISDAAYGAGWDGDVTTAPSKNAVYDKIESVVAGVGTGATPETRTASGGETNWVVTTPITSSHKLFVNGVKLVEGTDYTQTGSTFTFTGYTSLSGHKQEYFPDIAVPTTYNASEVSVSATPTNYTAGSANVEAHLAGIDTALSSAGGTSLEHTASITINNPNMSGGAVEQQIVAALGTNKVIIPIDFSFRLLSSSGGTGNQTINFRHNGDTTNLVTDRIFAFSSTSNNIGFSSGTSSFIPYNITGGVNKDLNVRLTSANLDSLTCTLYVSVIYRIFDITTSQFE